MRVTLKVKISLLASIFLAFLDTTLAASANQVELQFAENSLYVGNLYIGEDYILSRIIFDTRTKWTGILADNAKSTTNYDIYPTDWSTTNSGTEIAYMPNNDYERVTVTTGIGRDQDKLTGTVFREQMCLVQQNNFLNLCMKHQLFLAVDTV